MALLMAGVILFGYDDARAWQSKGKPVKAEENKAQDEEEEKDKDDVFDKEEQDKRIQKVLDAGWKEKTTAHYRIFSNSDDKAILDFMAGRMELMFKTYIAAFKPDKAITEKAPLFLHKDRQDYLAAGAPGGSGAFYSPVTRQLTGYLDKETTLNFFYHEGTHQFFDVAFPGAFSSGQVPTWMSEGVADCFGASEVKGSTIMFNSLNSAVGKGRLRDAKSVVGSEHLKDMLSMTKAQYYTNGAAHYAMGWSFCYFLFNYKGPGVADDGNNQGKYKAVISKLVKAFREKKTREEAYTSAFSGIDLDKMHDEWVKYIQGLR